MSLKTASRAINGEPNVAPATREKVRAAARSLGFRRNAVAADLARGGASSVVGFIAGDLANPFYSAVAGGMERELRRRGHQLMITSSDEDPERERDLTAELMERRVGALIVTPAGADHEALGREVEDGLPVVLVDRPVAGLDVDSVVIDNRGGVAAAVEHLLAHGHRRIALIGDDSDVWTFQERREAFVDTLVAHGVENPERYVRPGAHDAGLARAFVSEILEDEEPPTALLAANNVITLGTLQSLREHRSRHVALVGFDDFAAGDLLNVTVVDYDAGELGRHAAMLACLRIEDPTRPTHSVVVPTRLVARGSGEITPA
ncbi:MAG: LacI family transcriptional regulator [Promicromonosporaceae bacterium]|nr:LacI family transcriptional regulator [Promicromonosporaceae bacterium]